MIKKTFTKLVCVILCILTVVCSSGCVRSCIDKHVKEREQRDLSEVIEKMQEKKAVAETYIPECTEYSLKIMPTEYFETDEERTAQGFIKYRDFFKMDEFPHYHYSFNDYGNIIRVSIAYPQRTDIVSCSSTIIHKMPYNKKNIYGKNFFNSWVDGYALSFDNRFFLVTTISALQETIQAPALYLLDFENERVLYCGCALEFYDFHKNGIITYGYKMIGSNVFDYKIVKNGDAKNEENN